jgi:uncharacterized membrane protein YozB (DUF420 family)
VTADRLPAPSWTTRLPRLAQGALTAGFLFPAVSFVVLSIDPRFEKVCVGAQFRSTGLGPFPFAAALLAWLGVATTVVALVAGVAVLVTRQRRGLRWSDHGWFLFLVLGLLVLLVDLIMVIGIAGVGEPRTACPS